MLFTWIFLGLGVVLGVTAYRLAPPSFPVKNPSREEQRREFVVVGLAVLAVIALLASLAATIAYHVN